MNVADLPPERIEQCMTSAEKALQALCLQHNIRLAPCLADDLVTLLAGKELALWDGMAEVRAMTKEMKAGTVNYNEQLKFLKRAMAFAERARRHWLSKFCPVCWAWSWMLWGLGFRGPTQADADQVRDG